MATLEDARRLILEKVRTVGTEPVELLHSLGLVTAEEVVAPFDMPAADNSAMDGFAIRMEDLLVSSALRISGTITAGSTLIPKLRPGMRHQDHDRRAYARRRRLCRPLGGRRYERRVRHLQKTYREASAHTLRRF